MEFVVLLSVLAITLTQVIALPIVTKDDLKTKDGNTEKADKLMLTKALEPNCKVTINGTLNSSDKKFTVGLPNEENDENLYCTINYNHINKSIEVAPPFYIDEKTKDFEIVYDEEKETKFILELMAKETKAGKMVEMLLTVIGSGTSEPMYCSIKSFEELGHIYFKEGVKFVNSILFTFPDQ